MDFIKIKKIIILALALPVLYFSVSNINTFINQPDIKKINIPDMTDFSFNPNENQILFFINCSIPNPNSKKTSPSLETGIKNETSTHNGYFLSFSNR